MGNTVISLERSLLSYPWRVVLFEPWSAGSKLILQAEKKNQKKENPSKNAIQKV